MAAPIVVFNPEGKCVEARPGDSLLAVAKQAGVAIDSACGGVGSCGRCKVILRLGEPLVDSWGQLSAEEKQEGYLLACQSRLVGDLVVEVPLESQRGGLQILLEPTEARMELGVPLAQRLELSLRPPSLEDLESEQSRLLAAVRAARGETFPRLTMDLGAVQALAGAARAGDWRVEAVIADREQEGEIIQVLAAPAPSASERPARRRACGVAVDVGTTTIVVNLVDLDNGRLLATRAALNDQISFGEDVISRIVSSQERPDGLGQLQRAVLGTINHLLSELRDEEAVAGEELVAASCAGNTVMTQLLLGIEVGPIRRAPYIPVARGLPTFRAEEVGLEIYPRAPVFCHPCVSSYVGGDITSGLLATGLAEAPPLTLFIDMGTNGEIVLGNKDWLTCCSCSAGPAFEGSGIEHGMYATLGAIERLAYDPEMDRVEYATIGGARPRGLCGSALVDALATLLRAGALDRAGRINLGFPTPRVRVKDDQPQFVLVWGEEVGREEDIYLSEADFQNLIRSKAAVYAGTSLLLEALGISPEKVERVLVAGAFGNFLDAENAVMIGLLPDLPLEKIRFVGNTSVAGARLALLSREARRKAGEIAAKMTNFELSAESRFMEQYTAGLFLPHTDLGRFPSVAAHLEK
jgi:uncharacterized 2Fe-2S/4Fe-4S cluster protein (DUF4445 family)